MDVKEYVGEKMLLKELKEQEFEKSYYAVKFSINVDQVLNQRLKAVADELAVTRAELVRDLVTMALSEVENQLGLDHHDFKSEYANKVYADLEEIPLPDSNGLTMLSVPKSEFIKMINESRGKNNG